MHYNSKAGNCTFIFKLIICAGIFLFSRYINSFAQLVPQGREQNTNYFFRHITQQDGLAHNRIDGITQDSKGFIWILTPNGLQRYDGTRFLYFKDMVNNPYEADNSGAPLYLDYKNNFFWIAKQNKIEKFELANKHFTIYESEQLAQTLTLKCDTLTDESNRPCLLGEHVIYFYDDAAKKFNLYAINFNPYTKNISTTFITDTVTGQTWVNKNNTELLLFDRKAKKNYSGKNNPLHHPLLEWFGKLKVKGPFLRAIMQDSHHNIWISTWSDLSYRYNTVTKKITTYSLSGIMNSQTGIKTITTPLGLNYIYEDNHGTIWLAANNIGLLKYNPEKDDFTVISIGEVNKQNSKYSYEIFNIFQDSEENIWLGTNKGITVFNPYRQNYQIIQHEENNPLSLPKSEIMSFIQAGNGDILCGTWGGGITVFDSNRHFKKNIQLSGPVEYNFIWSFVKNDDGNIWAGCQHGYIHIYNPLSQSVKTIHPLQLNNKTIRCMAKDATGNIWMGLHDGKVAKWDKQQNKFYAFNDSVTELKQSFSPVLNIFFDSEQRCWVSTEKGLKQFDTQSRTYAAVYLPDINNPESILGRTVQGIEQYDDSTLAVGTVYGGINFLNLNTKTFSHFTTDDGLPSNSIYSLKKDAGGYLWFTTDYGLYKFKPADKKFIRYNIEPAVINASFTAAGFYPLKNGDWVTATLAEMIFFNPESTNYKTNSIPKVEIAGFKIFDNSLSIDSLLEINKPVNLSYKQNFLTIEFAALHFANLQQSKYYYRLSGVNSDWVNAGTKAFASYTNLPPGEYIFSVKAENGDETTQETSFKIIIHPPFWKTWWFVSLMTIGTILLLVGFIKWRIKNIRAVEAEKLKVQKLNAEQYKNKLELEQIVNYFSSSLIDKNKVDDVLWDVAKNLIGRLGFVDCMIYLWNADKTKMIQKAGYGPKGSIEEIESRHFDVNTGQGVVGYVMQTKEPLLIADTSKDFRYRIDEMVRLSELTVPMIYNDELIGVIDSEHPERHFYTQQHLQVLSTIATLMANKIKSIESEQSLLHTKIEILGINEKLSAAKLEALQSQLNPHFIFNCLNSIDNLIQNNEKEKATLYLSKFAKLVRSILETSKNNTVPCWKDVETLKVYLELEELRRDKKFSYEINMSDEIANGDYNVPPLIIQPLVENAIQHGLLNKTEADRKLIIDVSVNQNNIHYTIIDNGVGRAKAEAYKKLNNPSHQSMGMQITSDRINLFNRNTNGSVTITDLYDEQQQPSGTKVEVELLNQ